MEPAGTMGAPAFSHSALHGVYFDGFALYRRSNVFLGSVECSEVRADMEVIVTIPSTTNRAVKQAVLVQINGSFQVPYICTCDLFYVPMSEDAPYLAGMQRVLVEMEGDDSEVAEIFLTRKR